VAPVSSGGSVYAIGENWEDCDLNGYDDTTDHPVPWAGFDCTRGDTVPADWDGKPDSYPKPAGAGYTPPKKNTESDSTSGGSSATSGGSSATTGGSKSDSSKSTGSSKKNTKSTKGTKDTKSTKKTGEDDKTDEATTAAEDDETATEAAVETTEGALEPDADSETVTVAALETTGEELLPSDIPDTAAIVSTKGTVEIEEATGSELHAGSEVLVLGTGFAGNVDELQIEIHSTPTVLGVTTSDAEGSFEATVLIPEDLEAGSHNIVVLYQGQEITRQGVEVAPAAADSFLKAITVGFTQGSAELFAGLGILLALVVLSGMALLLNGIVRGRRRLINN
jgi:hypothetical protein